MEDEDDVIYDQAGLVRMAVDSMTSKALKRLRAHEVLFYPGTRLQWQPVIRMTDRVRVFVFCDNPDRPYTPPSDPVAGLGGGYMNYEQTSDQLNWDEIPSDILREQGLAHQVSGGFVGRFKRRLFLSPHLEAEPRDVLVVSLQADPIALYRELFPAGARGPWAVCINHVGWQAAPWKDFLLGPDAARPDCILGPKNQLHAPWLGRWQVYRGWDDTALLQVIGAPDAEVFPERENPWFRMAGGPILPEAIEAPGSAVHLTLEEFQDHNWLGVAHIYLDTEDMDLIASLAHLPVHIRALPLAGLPLNDATLAIAKAATDDNVQQLHISRFGFEDEAALIDQAWVAAVARGCPASLVVHPRCPADTFALRGYVCADLVWNE